MAKPNKTCIICGKKYSYCNNCYGDRNKASWYAIFESDNCHELYRICTDFRDKKIDVNEARKELSKCDIKDLENFNKGFKKIIEKILTGESRTASVDEDIDKDKNTDAITPTKMKASSKTSSTTKNVK